MDNWLVNIVGDVDSLHVEIDNLNDLLGHVQWEAPRWTLEWKKKISENRISM
jgi:hypothetical protein